MTLKEIFPKATYSEPKFFLIPQIEMELELKMPQKLKKLYLETDGFRENIGNSKYLFSLKDDDGIGSLLSTTKFFHNEKIFPDIHKYIFFGSSSAGEYWAINTQNSTVISYHYSMGNEFEKLDNDIVELYKKDYSLYNL
ncbi:SMI1/KNR4 family protein [Dokdonia sp. LLG6352-1]|uniref:SMI1/KNR4 family protein n=1 Tax=Dokdonia sp. LLG6352-1 TaxID=3160831 RepID=UPI003869910A